MSGDELFDEINTLLLDYQSGSITFADLSKLRSLLKDSAEARRHLAKIQRLETAIYLECVGSGASQVPLLVPDPQSVTAQIRRSRWNVFAGTAAAVFITGALLLWHFAGQDTTVSDYPERTAAAPDEAKDDSVAIFSQSFEAEWSGEKAPSVGSSLSPGKYELRKGLAQMEFSSSARMSVKAPAVIEIISAFSVTLHEGVLRAYVPGQAHGFTVSTSQVKVVDRGTEFTVTATPGNSRVQVLQGEVELFNVRDPRRNTASWRLVTGNALAIDPSGNMNAVETGPPALDSFEALQRQMDAKSGLQFNAWQKHRSKIISNPNLVAYYDFQRHGEMANVLYNHRNSPRAVDGAIVGCAWSGGRWPGKDALEFKRPGDRVRINIPGKFNNLTLAAWIRADGLPNRYQSLLLTDGYEVGHVHWQITQEGTLRLGLREADSGGGLRGTGYASPRLFGPKQIGIWNLVCTVYDTQMLRVSHYLNGKEVNHEELKNSQLIEIGSAEIGNWGVPISGDSHPIRNFNGRIDELYVWSSALSANEVQVLFDSERP